MLLIFSAGCARSPQARRDKYLAKGKSFLEKKDYSRALLEFKNAAGVMPRDPEAYYQMGEAAYQSGDIRTAVIAYRKALDLNPKHAGAQLRMAQLMANASEGTWLKDAESRLEELLRSGPADAEVLNTLALTELKLGKIGSAVQNLEDVLAKSPANLSSSVLLARARLLQNDPKSAEVILKAARDAAPKSPGPHIILGEFYLSENRRGEADAEFQSALRLAPDNGAALIDLARLQVTSGRKQDAESTLKHLAAKGEPSYRSIYAQYLFQDGRRDEAVREFERLVRENRDDRVARTQLVAAYRAVNRGEDARKILDAALKSNPKDQDALLQRAELSIDAKNYTQAEADVAYVIHLSPNSAEAHYILAKVKQAHGSGLTYRQELTEALRLNPYLLQVRLELAHHLASNNSTRAAFDLLDAAPQSQRTTTGLIVQRNWTLWTAGDLAEMRKGVDAGLARERSADLLIQDGLLKIRAGNHAAARTVLEEALKLNGADVRALAALSQSYAAQKQTAIALEKVKEYAKRQPKSAAVQDFLGTLLAANGNRQQAREAFQAAKAADPHFSRADVSLAELDMLEGKVEDAYRTLQKIVAADGSNTTMRLWLANVMALKGDNKAALDQFRQVVASDPNNPQALNNYAYLLAEYGNPTEALKYAQKAQELAPDSGEYRDTLGWILYRQGLYPLAVAELERAVSKKSPQPVWRYHLAMAYGKAGNMTRGRVTLEAALKANPNLPEAKQAESILNTNSTGLRP